MGTSFNRWIPGFFLNETRAQVELQRLGRRELLLSLGSRSSSLFRLFRKSPNVSESTFFDICLSRNQSSYCNTHLSYKRRLCMYLHWHFKGELFLRVCLKQDYSFHNVNRSQERNLIHSGKHVKFTL